MQTHPSSVRHRVKITDPALTRRKGLFAHPGSLILAAIALLYTAYIFGFIPQELPDRLFTALSSHSQWITGNGLILEVAILLAALLLLYTFIMPIIAYYRHRAKRTPTK